MSFPQNVNLQPFKLGCEAFFNADITWPERSELPSDAKLDEPRPASAVF